MMITRETMKMMMMKTGSSSLPVRRRGSVVVGVCVLVACVFCVLQPSDAARLPPAPRKLRARAISPHVIKVRWRDPGQNKGRAARFYSVRYSAAGEESESKFLQSAETRVRVSKLHPNTTYVFAVRSVAGKGGSPWSNSVSATTAVVEHRVVTKLKATALSSESIRLSWKLPRRVNETVAYAILWAELEAKNAERKAVVANGSTSFTLDKLRPHRLYRFRVQSMLSEGPGGSTEKVIARPYSDRPGKAPRNMQLHYSNHSYVLVKWRPPPLRQRNGALLGYKVQYKRKGSQRGDLCSVITQPQDRQYVLTDIADGETYKVRVAASTINGTGPFTKWQAVTIPATNSTDTEHKSGDVFGDEDTGVSDVTPAQPEKLRLSDVRSTAATMTWSQPEPPDCCPIVAYRIMGRNLNTSVLSGEMVTGPSPEARVSFLQPDTLYGFNVSAYSISGESQHSEELIVHTLPAEPPSIPSVRGSSVLEGSSVNLTCNARAEPPPEVTWYGPNKTLSYSPGRVTNSLLHREEGVHVIRLHKSARDVTSHLLIDSVTLQQGGTYSCVAKNSAGTVRMPVRLQVNVAPSIVDTSDMSVLDGKGAQLVCAVTGTPLPEVVWLRDNSDDVFEETSETDRNTAPTTPFVTSLVEEGEGVRRSYLHFPRSSLRHHGNYTCLARSLAGTNESKVLLQVNIPPPPVVQNLRAMALSPQSVSVSWDRPFEYNYTIDGYRVSYRQVDGAGTETETHYLDTQGLKQDIYGLQPRHSYVISVTPYNVHTLGVGGREVKVTTLTNEGLQPANVSAVALNSSMIQLDWGSSRNIDRMYILGYNIYYRRENDTREEMLFIEGNRNKQFLIGLGRDETYYLRIATLTTWGFEASSQWIRIQKHPHEFLPPAPPKDIKAVTSVDAIRVTWTPSRDPGSRKPPLLGYRLIYGPVDKPSEVDRVELDPRADRFSIRGLNDSTLYIIQLRAFNKYTMSDPMYVRAATKALPPSTVINARAVALSSKEIHVHWNRPARGHVTKYQLRYWRPGKRDKQSAWLQAPTADYVAGSLKKFSSYRFEIIPFAGDVIGEGSVIFADTLASKPDAPPRDVTVKTINATHLMVTWKPPPEGAQNGEVTGYKVIMKKKGGPRLAKFSVDADRYNYTFKDLKPGSTYKVRMAAINNNGTGPFTDWVVGRTDTIEMRQPEGPQWLKLDVTSHSVVVTWSVPRDIGVPVLGYIVGYGRYIPEVYRHIVGPGQRSFVIEGLKPETEYIVSVRAFNHMGESVPQFAVVHTLSAPPVLALEVPVKLRVLPLSPTHMALSWLDPALLKRPPAPPPASPSTPTSLPPPPPSDGRVYLIRYSAISGEEYQYLNASTTSLNVSGLDVATTYEFAVRTTRGGEKSGWSLPVVNTTQQTAPSSAPSRVTVLALPSSPPSLQLNWSQPAFPNGHITEYIVYYTSDPTVETKLWMMKTTKKKNVVITDVMPHTSYYFRIQARNMAGYGPLSHTVIFNPPTDIRAAPSNVTVWSFYGNISTAVEVMWLKPRLAMGHITGYMVYYTTDDDQSDSNWMIEGERGLSTLILGLMHNVTYYFKVRARYGAGLGPFSGVVSFTTPPEAEREEGVWEGDTEQQEVETTTVKPDSVTETSTTPPRTTDFDAFVPETSTVKTPVPPHNWTLDVGTDHVNVTWEPPPTTRQPITNEDVNSTQPISVELDLPVNSTQSNGTQPVVYHTDASTIQPISSEEAQLAESRQPITYQLELLGGAKRDELVTTRIVKDNSYTFTELEEDTSYVVKVKVVTEHGTSPPAIQAFHTLSSSQTVQDDLDR